MVRWIYNLFFPFVFLLLLPAYLRRMLRRGNYRRNFGQRFGFYSTACREQLGARPAPMWLQAVSVGEMLVALKLVDALRGRQPDLPLVLSTTTTTGYQLARERAASDIVVIYTPVDLSWAVRRAFDVVRPRAVVIVDGGLWPNLLWEAAGRKVSTTLVNARLSPRSERRFRCFRFLAAPMFRSLGLVCVSEIGDLSRWQQLGVPFERLRHTGSIKFDDAASAEATGAATEKLRDFLGDLGIGANDPVLLAGSTHPGEELAVANVFKRLRDDFPGLRLFVAPRHVERAREIRLELETLDLRVGLRSGGPAVQTPFDVLLLDSTGELRDWYPLATVVFIGKSLTAIGGQNPAEAVAARRAVMFGPHMENFRALVAQLLAADGAVQVPDVGGLESACRLLLADSPARSRMADNALQQLTAHRGAAERTAGLLLPNAKLSTCQAE